MRRFRTGVVTYERLGICLTGLCIVGLYIFVLTHRQAEAYPLVPPIAFEHEFERAKPRPPAKPVPVMLVNTSDKLSAVFRGIGYRLDRVRQHGRVPRLFLARLPRDLSELKIPSARKVLFLKSALPLVLQVNELILAERNRVIALRKSIKAGETLDPSEAAWLDKIRANYELDQLNFDELLRRIDIVPPSLALAQGAEESGWGTSRFAREGNALFGQRIFKGRAGIVPKRRDEGATHRVRSFDHLIDGVKAYADNLNTHFAYDALRRAREKMRLAGTTIDGDALARTLLKYSERREDYVRSIRTIIRVNDLHLFDTSRLGHGLTIIASAPGA